MRCKIDKLFSKCFARNVLLKKYKAFGNKNVSVICLTTSIKQVDHNKVSDV